MTDILLSEAVAVVRRNMDEAGVDTSAMYPDGTTDTTALEDTIKGMTAQAINDVCAIAPARMMQGVRIADKTDLAKYSAETLRVTNDIILFVIGGRVARITAFQAVDSKMVLTGSVDESSPEGRMQLNKNTAGVYDDPCLVRLQHYYDSSLTAPYTAYRYYALKQTPSSNDAFCIKALEYYPIAERNSGCAVYSNTSNIEKFIVPDLLKEAILKHLTGLVLTIYGETDKARFYLQNISNTQE